jgi:hypothetical protein
MVGTLAVGADHAEGEFWSQQDDVTLHTARETTDYLTAVSPERIISRFGDSAWPASSPDLTELGYVSLAILQSESVCEQTRHVWEAERGH